MWLLGLQPQKRNLWNHVCTVPHARNCSNVTALGAQHGEGIFCSSSADTVVLENNQEQQPEVGRDLSCENNNNQGWGMGDRAVVGPSEALVRGH